MSDAHKAFSYLQENISSWVKQLDEIGQRIQDQQEEIAKAPVQHTKQLRRKTGSTESLRPGKDDELAPNAEGDNATPAPLSKEQQAIQAKRKRKTASVLSGHASGPAKYRTRTMIVVYYDSEVQDSFEKLVRNIGTGRNLLRKGKMAARMEALEAANTDESNDDDIDGDDNDAVLSKIGYRPKLGLTGFRSTRTRSGFAGLADTSAGECFDETDKELETAQSLCERGAHQFLRDGDCRTEINGCKEAFQKVLAIANRELEKLKAKEEKVRVKQEENAERLQSQVQAKSTNPNPTSLEIDVDDEDDDGGLDFLKNPTLTSLGPIRLTSRC